MMLFDYQQDAVTEIVGKGDVPSYLAYEMGTGKTPIAIEVAKRRKVVKLLILCPPVGRLTWAKELKRWWPQAKVTVVTDAKHVQAMAGNGVFVVSYNLLSMSKTGGYDFIGGIKAAVGDQPFEMTVLDEAHALKNPGAIRTKAVLHSLLPILGWCLPMSGTPTPNHQGELFPILRTIFPETVRKMDGSLMKQYEFENVYCDIVNKWFNGRSVRTIDGSKNIETLRQKLAPYVLRKRKRDVLKSLPDMMFDTYPIACEVPLWAVDWKAMSDAEFLHALQRSDEHVMRRRRQLGEAKVNGAVEAVTDTLESCRRKVLVFAHHTSVIDGLMQGLASFNPVRLDGRDSSKARQVSIDRFLADPSCRVFVGQIQAAGTSITLVGPGMECSDVFFVESSFSPGDNVQAASRVHRIGQKDAVQVWFLTAYGTYDDRINDIVSRKARDFQLLFS